jgi:hypothetical protein
MEIAKRPAPIEAPMPRPPTPRSPALPPTTGLAARKGHSFGAPLRLRMLTLIHTHAIRPGFRQAEAHAKPAAHMEVAERATPMMHGKILHAELCSAHRGRSG